MMLANPRTRRLLTPLSVVLSWPFVANADLTEVDDIAGTFDKLLTIAPVVVCDDDGSLCGDQVAMFKRFAIRTFAKAGIALAIQPTRVLNNTTVNTLDDPRLMSLYDPGASSNKKTINAWFVYDLFNARGQTLYGAGTVGRADLAVNSTAVMSTNPLREDTFSHEVGHNLGLEHGLLGADSPNNLMAAGDLPRNAPTSLMTAEQISVMRASTLVSETPEILLTHSSSADGSSVAFKLSFANMPDGIDLRRFSIDLPDLNLIDPHGVSDARPYEYLLDLRTDYFGALSPFRGDAAVELFGMEFDGSTIRGSACSGADAGLPFSVSYGENTTVYFESTSEAYVPQAQSYSTNGAAEIVFDFGSGSSLFHTGDEFNFSINLLEHHVHEEVAYPYSFGRDVTGAIVQFDFDMGLSLLTDLLGADAVTSSRHITALVDYDPALGLESYGPQYLPGERETDGPLETEPVNAVPLPGGLPLALSGLMLLAARSRPISRERGTTERLLD